MPQTTIYLLFSIIAGIKFVLQWAGVWIQRWICANKARLTLPEVLVADVVVLEVVQGKLLIIGYNHIVEQIF